MNTHPRVYRRRNLSRYAVDGHASFCSGVVESHVRYEVGDDAYRVELRCACRASEQRLVPLFSTYVDAEIASKGIS